MNDELFEGAAMLFLPLLLLRSRREERTHRPPLPLWSCCCSSAMRAPSAAGFTLDVGFAVFVEPYGDAAALQPRVSSRYGHT